jgi:hypothetical protein
MGAEARIAKAIAFAWLAGGVAIACCLASLGLAAAFYGYSYVISVGPAAEQTAKAMVSALERSAIKTTVTGIMSLAPKSQVHLAPGQTVRLEDGAVVGLDPNSSVRVIGDLKVDIPQPSKRQLQLDATSKTDELPFTAYTIFRSVSFGSGKVVSGWNYDLSDTSRPKSQFCYYGQSIERGLSTKYTLAFNGIPRRLSSQSKLPFNFDTAVMNCIWFSGS